MTLLPACNNTLEVAQGRFTHGADIEVDEQKDSNQESKDHMELISKKYSAEAQKLLENKLREEQGPAGDKEQRQYEIHHSHI